MNESLQLYKGSTKTYRVNVNDIIANDHVVNAWLMIKADDSDSDSQALLSLEISESLSDDGVILNTGELTHIAIMDFIIQSDTLLLVPEGIYISAVKLLMDSGNSHIVPGTIRKTIISDGVVNRIT